MKRIVALLALTLLLVALSFVVWKLQPWMTPGKAIHIKSEHLGNFDFEVWQRKNDSLGEPFATGLFVQNGTNDWRVFLLDFEDMFHPRVVLRREVSSIVVFHGGARLGVLDEQAQTFTRSSNGAILEAATVGKKPPGDWWLR